MSAYVYCVRIIFHADCCTFASMIFFRLCTVLHLRVDVCACPLILARLHWVLHICVDVRTFVLILTHLRWCSHVCFDFHMFTFILWSVCCVRLLSFKCDVGIKCLDVVWTQLWLRSWCFCLGLSCPQTNFIVSSLDDSLASDVVVCDFIVGKRRGHLCFVLIFLNAMVILTLLCLSAIVVFTNPL